MRAGTIPHQISHLAPPTNIRLDLIQRQAGREVMSLLVLGICSRWTLGPDRRPSRRQPSGLDHRRRRARLFLFVFVFLSPVCHKTSTGFLFLWGEGKESPPEEERYLASASCPISESIRNLIIVSFLHPPRAPPKCTALSGQPFSLPAPPTLQLYSAAPQP